MPERRSFLILPESADIDLLPYSLLGWAFDDLRAYWDRWGQPLLTAERPVGVFVSIPQHYLNDPEVRAAWEEEKGALCRTFEGMANPGLEVDGVHDLSGESAEEAREAVRDLLLRHRQVIGIAHVPETCRDVPLNEETRSALEDIELNGGIPLSIDLVLGSGERERVVYRYPLAEERATQGLGVPQLALRIRFQAVPYFAVGSGGALDRDFFSEVAQQLEPVPCPGPTPQIRGRAIFVGCSTAPTGLAQELVESGLAIVALGIPRPISLTFALALLRAVLIAGYQPANQAIEDIMVITAKLLGFPRWSGSTPSFLVTKSSFPSGESAFYWVFHSNPYSLPELEPVTAEEAKRRLEEAANCDHWAIVDVPPEIRGEMAEALRGRLVLWPAWGSSCASVAGSLSGAGGVYCQLGHVDRASPGLTLRLLTEFTCIKVQNLAVGADTLPFDREVPLSILLDRLKDLCRSGATLVVGSLEQALIRGR